MQSREQLARKISAINGRGYKAYKELSGEYDFGRYFLFVDYVQGDPFAAPSRIRLRVEQRVAGFPGFLFQNASRRVALEDFLTRWLGRAISRLVKGSRGTGKSGLVATDSCGQEILERTSIVVNKDFVEARLVIGLPAAGRTVLSREAQAMFFAEIPRVVEEALLYSAVDAGEVRRHVELAEDADHLRRLLPERDLVGFVLDGAILPRQSGVNDHPLTGGQVVPFHSPPDLRVSFELPNHGRITGMGLPKGVTLIVGGGYHGKSTLLKALERGIYNHIPGDGREWVITVPDAVKIRAEDGRQVEKVDISVFINNLPFGQDTVRFSSDDASGSTSQAANIVEALEMGADLLLLDEDTSATNFMIRDVRMQQLVSKEKEPITPFIDRVRELFEIHGVSSILVLGGSGDYFDVADTVIMMDNYSPNNVTARAREIANHYETTRVREGEAGFTGVKSRIPLPAGFDPFRGHKKKIDAKGVEHLIFGHTDIHLHNIEQLVDASQTRVLGDALDYAVKNYVDGKRSLRELVECITADMDKHGLDIISPFFGQHPGEYARPRKHEIAATINRMRTLRVL